MPDPIVYQFVPSGHGDVVSAIRSITAAAQESRRAMDDLAGASSRVRLGPGGTRGGPYRSPGGGGGGGGGESPEEKAVKKSTERIISLEQKAAEKRAIIQQRAEEKRAGLVRTSTAAILREIDREAAAVERAAERKRRANEKELRAIQRANQAFYRDPIGAMPSLLRYGAGAIAGLGATAFATGSALIGGAVRESMQTQEIANRVSINSRMAGQQGVDATTLRKEFERTATSTPGQNAADIGRATQAYVDLTGDLDTARSSMSTFATVASATGAKVEDVATAAASIGKQFDVKKVEDMQKVFAGLAFQGKGGAMTLKDIAAQFQRLAAAGNAFGLGKGPEAVAKLGGILQIARSATGNPRQAATSVENIFRQLTAKAGKAGVKLYDKAGGQRDVNEVLAETIAHVGGQDLGNKKAALSKFFGAQGVRGINPLIATAADAMHGMHGKDAEKAAYDAVLAKLREMASISADWSEVQKDAAQAQRDSSAQVQAAWEKLKSAAGDRLAPKFAEIANKLASDGKVIDMFVTAIEHAATVLEAMAAMLQKMGIISGGTSDEKASGAKKEADELGKKLGAMGPYEKLSPEKQAEYRALNAEYQKKRQLAADEGARAKLTSAAVEGVGQPGGGAAAAAAYRKLGGTGAHTATKILGTISNWTTIQGLFGGKDFTKDDVGHALFGENLDQRQVRHAAEAKGVDVSMKPTAEAMQKAASDLQNAASKLAKAAGRAPGSIAGTPQTPGAAH